MPAQTIELIRRSRTMLMTFYAITFIGALVIACSSSGLSRIMGIILLAIVIAIVALMARFRPDNLFYGRKKRGGK